MPESQGALTHVRYPRFYVYTQWVLQLPFRRRPFALLCWPGLAFLGLTGLQQSEGMFQEGYTTGALHREQNDRGLLPCPEASAVEAGVPGSMDMLAGDLGCGGHPCALPLPHGSSTGSPKQSLCTHLELTFLPLIRLTRNGACAPTWRPSFGNCSPRSNSGLPGSGAGGAHTCGHTGPCIFALFQSCDLKVWPPDSLV